MKALYKQTKKGVIGGQAIASPNWEVVLKCVSFDVKFKRGKLAQRVGYSARCSKVAGLCVEKWPSHFV